MIHHVTIMMNRRTDGSQEVLGTTQIRPYKFGDPLEELPTVYSFEVGTPTRAAEAIVKLCSMEVHDANGNTWPEGERELGVGDVLIITDEQERMTIYARGRYSWTHLSENQLPYPEPAEPT